MAPPFYKETIKLAGTALIRSPNRKNRKAKMLKTK